MLQARPLSTEPPQKSARLPRYRWRCPISVVSQPTMGMTTVWAGIAQTVVMPMVGWLTTLIGHRHLYLGSLALFCGGSVLSGLAWSIESLIVFQIISGLGVG